MALCSVPGPELVHQSTERTRNPARLWDMTMCGTCGTCHYPVLALSCLATWLVLWLLPLARALPCLGAAPLRFPHCWHRSSSLLIPMALSCLQMRTLNSYGGTQIPTFEPFLWALVYPQPGGVIGWPGWPTRPRYSPASSPTAPHLPTASRGLTVCFPRMGLAVPRAAPRCLLGMCRGGKVDGGGSRTSCHVIVSVVPGTPLLQVP